MKRLLFFALTALVLVSCATTTLFDAEGRQLSKSEQDRITASVVSQRLAQRKYRIFADYMYPQRAPGVRLNDDWGVEVGRDSIGFFLPYFGQVYMADPAKGPGMIFIAALGQLRGNPGQGGPRPHQGDVSLPSRLLPGLSRRVQQWASRNLRYPGQPRRHPLYGRHGYAGSVLYLARGGSAMEGAPMRLLLSQKKVGKTIGK